MERSLLDFQTASNNAIRIILLNRFIWCINVFCISLFSWFIFNLLCLLLV